jgi:hypothetical protein
MALSCTYVGAEPSAWRSVADDAGVFWMESMRLYRVMLRLDELDVDLGRVLAALIAGGWGPVRLWRPAEKPPDWPEQTRPSPIPKPQPGKLIAHTISVVFAEGMWIGRPDRLGVFGYTGWPLPPHSEIAIWELWTKETPRVPTSPKEPVPPSPPPPREPEIEPPAGARGALRPALFAGAAALAGVGIALAVRATSRRKRAV